MARIVEKRTTCLRRLGEDRAGGRAFSRFLDNASVTTSEIVAHEAARVAQACAGRHILAIQDTTEFNFNAHKDRKKGFGTVGNGVDIGLFAHPVIAVDAAHRGLVGVVDTQIINRLEKPAAPRRKRMIGEKESRRWLDGLEASSSVLAMAAMVTVIADRESDIYAEFVAPRPAHVHLLTRAAQDRLLAGGEKLFRIADTLPEQGRRAIKVAGKAGARKPREAGVAVSFTTVTLTRPASEPDKNLPERVTLTLVTAREVDPPPGEAPIQWRLLTTHQVTTLEKALLVIDWYRARWTIEQVFRAAKSQGLDAEASQVVEAHAMEKLVAVALIAATRIMQLVMARDGASGQRIEDAIDPADEPLVEALIAKNEGKTERQKNPHPKGSLARFAWLIGRLGGWDGYVGHGYKPAGPITIAHGLERYLAIRQGWSLKDV